MTLAKKTGPKRRPRKKKDSWGNQNTYRGDQLRSNWETYVAKLLLYAGYRYEYEHRRYFLANGVSYLPDFYLPEYNVFIEVKGILLDKDRIKITLFKQKVTSRLLYLGKQELEYIYGGSSSAISKLDFKNYIPTQPELIRLRTLIQKTTRGNNQ